MWAIVITYIAAFAIVPLAVVFRSRRTQPSSTRHEQTLANIRRLEREVGIGPAESPGPQDFSALLEAPRYDITSNVISCEALRSTFDTRYP